jgi:hypothetical protein
MSRAKSREAHLARRLPQRVRVLTGELVRPPTSLDENDGVQGVYSNFDVPERVLEVVAS